MNLLMDGEKRRRLIEQIERTAEEMRLNQGNGIDLNGDYSQLFLLRSRNAVYSKEMNGKIKVRFVLVWFMIVLFLISATALVILMRRLEMI